MHARGEQVLQDETTGRRSILFVVPWELKVPGGVSQVVTNLARVAAESGAYRPMVLVNLWEYRKPSTSDEEVRTIRFGIPSPSAPARSLRTLLDFLRWLPVNLWRLNRILRQNDVALVNIHYPTPAALHFCILRALGISRVGLVLSVHGLDIANAARTSGFERFCWLRLLQCADRIVACSDALAREVVALHPTSPHRVVTVHNGVDRRAIEAERDRAFTVSELEGQPYILNVATFEYKKGQDVLLDAFHLIAGEFPKLRLVLVGRSGNTLAELKQRTAAYGLKKRVLFFEDVPHCRIATFFERATLFCLPSRAEPFGIVLLEAALFEIPVIASRVGGVGEVIRDDVDARLVESENPRALATALRELLLDEETRVRYARDFSRRALGEFSWERAFQEYATLFAKLITDVPCRG